jgi:hypothetical protein
VSVIVEEDFKCWMAKRKAALVMDIIQGKTSVSEALTCLVFSSQFHLETLAPVVDSDFHWDTNSSGVWYSRLEWGRTAL